MSQKAGILCDNPGCGWRDMTINIEDAETWLNIPCPNCGNNLLTEDDLEHFKLMLTVAKEKGVKLCNSETEGSVFLNVHNKKLRTWPTNLKRAQ